MLLAADQGFRAWSKAQAVCWLCILLIKVVLLWQLLQHKWDSGLCG